MVHLARRLVEVPVLGERFEHPAIEHALQVAVRWVQQFEVLLPVRLELAASFVLVRRERLHGTGYRLVERSRFLGVEVELTAARSGDPADEQRATESTDGVVERLADF